MPRRMRARPAFLVLARKAGTLRPGELASWLHAVARRTALKARSTTSHLPLPADPPAAGRDPLAELTGRELLSILEDEIQKLPAAYRLPVTLCCVEGLSQEEAARRLNTTPGSVRGRVDRGRAKLHAKLTSRGLTPVAVLAVAEFARGTVPPTPLTAASQVLAEGVLRAMFLTRVRLAVVALLTVGIGVGLSARATGPEKPPAAVLRPDPKEKPVAPDLAGVWVAEVVSPDGKTRREMTMRFVDGKHLVWSITQSAPGARVTTTARYEYRLAGGELTLPVLERYNGGEKLPPRKDDQIRRVYPLKWGGKDAFSIRDTADPTSVVDFRRENAGGRNCSRVPGTVRPPARGMSRSGRMGRIRGSTSAPAARPSPGSGRCGGTRFPRPWSWHPRLRQTRTTCGGRRK